MASGLYNTPFAHVAKKSSTEYSHSTRPAELQESFMEVTRATRHCISSLYILYERQTRFMRGNQSWGK